MHLVLTQRAEQSLQEISDYYVREHSVERALRVIESMEDAFDLICQRPLAYPVCFDIEKPADDVRQIIVHHTFKVVYRIKQNSIEVIEIFHGKRNPSLLKDL